MEYLIYKMDKSFWTRFLLIFLASQDFFCPCLSIGFFKSKAFSRIFKNYFADFLLPVVLRLKAGRAKVSLVPELATQLSRVHGVYVEHHLFSNVKFENHV
mgnify:CR=1 FL=1